MSDLLNLFIQPVCDAPELISNGFWECHETLFNGSGCGYPAFCSLNQSLAALITITSMQQDPQDDDLIDPDPFSTMLVVLGALGSIASLYAIVDSRVQAHRTERESNRYAIRDSLMGAETALNELRGYIRSLQIAFSVGTQSRGQQDSMMSMAQFGNVQLLFAREGHERWREIEEGVMQTVTRIQRHMSDLMRHFAVTKLRLQPDTATRLQRTIAKLNEIVRSLAACHFAELFRQLEEVAGECMDTMSQIRMENGGFIR